MKAVGGVCGVVLLRNDGAALLQWRDDKPTIQDPGIWVFPGGHAEPGEKLHAAAKREFQEETCYRCDDLRFLVSFSAEDLGYPGEYDIVFFWTCFDGAQEVKCCEGQDLQFIARDAVSLLPTRDYLPHVWDMAIAARNTMIDNELSHRTITGIGRYKDLHIEGHTSETVLALYRRMLCLRSTEEALIAEYHPADEMRCPIHFCVGQEAIPAALSLLLRPDDMLFSHHRSHGYYFAKGAPMRELFAEIYGKATGANGGRAGSQDISHSDSRFYSGAILAGAVSIAVGAAFAFKYRKSKQISVSGFGEGATDEGAFWEAMNYAGKQQLPILFIIENNRYATFSDQLNRQASDNICERVRTFGVRAKRIFGNDVIKVYDTLSAEIKALREGRGPSLVEAYTYRWNSHVGPEDDNVNAYRTVEEISFWKANCPIDLLEEKLRQAPYWSDEIKTQMEDEIRSEIAANFQFAKESPFPKNIGWHDANWSASSPLADSLLTEAEGIVFDHTQVEARLGPY